MTTKIENIATQLASAANVKNIWSKIIINVKTYGAKGDGVTVDTVAMQAAVNYANSIGKHEIYLPAGHYIYGVLTGTSGITFIGDGVTLTGTTVLNLTSLAALQADVAQRFKNAWVDVKLDYGAIGDGNSHPLSERYATLAAAQAIYPHATSLTNEIDWAAIQGAINSGYNVWVPFGTYKISYCLIVQNLSNRKIEGFYAKFKLWDSGDSANAYNTSLMRIYRCTNVEIKGIYLDGNRSHYAPSPGIIVGFDQFRGIWIVGCTNITIRECFIMNTVGVAIKVVGDGALGGIPNIAFDSTTPGVSGLKVLDCVIDNACDGLQVNLSLSSRINFNRNKVTNIDEHGFTLYPGTKNAHALDNHFEDIGRYANNGFAIRYFETVHGTIHGNYIERCTNGIGLEDLAYTVPNQYVSVKDNTIIDSSYFYQNSTYALMMSGNNIEVENNNIGETTTSAKYFAVTIDGKNIIFHNNKINYTSGTSANYLQIGYKTTPSVLGATDISIKDNFLSGATPNAINVKSTGCSNIEVYKNRISGYLYSAFVDTGRACIFHTKKKYYRFTVTNASASLVVINSADGIPYYLINEECFINNIHIYTNGTVTGTINFHLFNDANSLDTELGSPALASVTENKILAKRGTNTDIFDLALFQLSHKLILKCDATFTFTGTVAVVIEMDVIDYKN